MEPFTEFQKLENMEIFLKDKGNMQRFIKDKGKKIKNKFIIRSLSKLIKFDNLKNKIVTN